MAIFITGVFYDPTDAERTVEELEELGYARDQISVITNDGYDDDAVIVHDHTIR